MGSVTARPLACARETRTHYLHHVVHDSRRTGPVRQNVEQVSLGHEVKPATGRSKACSVHTRTLNTHRGNMRRFEFRKSFSAFLQVSSAKPMRSSAYARCLSKHDVRKHK